MIHHGVKKEVLKNGLTVLIKEKHDSPVVAIFTYVKAGYFNEPDRLIGISHLLEHMFFKGTATRAVGQIAQETKMLGGFLNASTIYDHTLYYTVLPSRSFAQGLDIQADALINSQFAPEELRKETEVVIQEAKRKLDTPSAFAREKMFELAFDRHRMRRWRIGTEDGLRALTRTDFLEFHRNHYRPENIILTIVGDIKSEEALKQVENYYGDFEQGTVLKESSPPEPRQQDFKYCQIQGDIQHSRLVMGFHTVKMFHPDAVALEILAFLLGRGRSSRLYQTLKQELNLVQTIAVPHYDLQDLGLFMVESSQEPNNLEAAEQKIFEELAKIKSNGVTEAELTKSRNVLELQYASNLQTASGQAGLLAAYEAFGSYTLADEYLQKLSRVTEADIYRVANTYLRIENCSLLEYVPQSFEAPPAAAATKQRQLGKYLQGAEADRQKAELSGCALKAFELHPKNVSATNVKRFVLPNGVTLVVKPDHRLPLVSAGFFLKGGRLHENADNAGVTGLMLRTSLKGTQNRSATDIALGIENLGASIHISNDPDSYSYRFQILAKNFEAGLNILTDVMLYPAFPEQELLKEKTTTLNAILQEKDDMFRHPLTMFYAAFFGKHPYGLPAYGMPDVIQDCVSERLLTWHTRCLQPNKLIVVLAGDIESDQARDLIAKRFGSLESTGDSNRETVSIPELEKIEEAVELREKEQTAIVLGFPGPAFTDPEYYPLLVLQNAISGLGGRFFEELRGKQSLAYTVSAFLVSRLCAGAFVSYIATSPEKEDLARDGLLTEYQKLLHTPLAYEELQRAIQYTIGTYQISLETNSAKMAHYAHYELLGKSLDEVEKFTSHVEQVTTDDILKAVNKYFDVKRYAMGIVRGKKD
ncbi:MAG: M16 family metallopeptidase [bacterium]